ncbi:hypothetical protein [Microbacterium sp. NPDC056569]|uniref:hypothetical protein n=1 Tax=Microbacterium sp. NPDC056569 TaxID=3345867 RepID=UPI003672D5F4
MGTRSDEAPRWVKALVWSLAIAFAIVGVVLSVVLSSVWPLVVFFGLAVPMIPMGSFRPRRDGSRVG